MLNKYRRKLTIAALAATTAVPMVGTAVVPGTASAATSSTMSGTTIAASTNVRAGASTSTAIIARVAQGTSFTGTVDNGWMHITSGTYAGKFIAMSTLNPTTNTATSGTVTARTIYSSTNVRSAASTTSAIVGRLAQGSTITGALSNGWIKVTAPAQYAGKYVSYSVLQYVSSASGPTPAPPSTPSAPVYKVSSPYSCAGNPLLPTTSDSTCTQAVQYVLNSWMIRNNPAGAQLLTVNGTYGSVTTADVTLFQKKNGLTQSGKMDSATWKALAAASGTTTTTTSAGITGAAGDTHPAFPSTVKLTDGRLLLMFTSAKQHMNNTTPSTLWKTYSSDGGYTWSTPEQVILPTGMQNTIGGLGIATSGPLKGHPIVTTWSNSPDLAHPGNNLAGTTTHTFISASTDLGGNTWGPLTDISVVNHGSTYTASPIVQVDDTNFTQAVYVYNGGTSSARTVGVTYNGSKFLVGTMSTIAAATAASSSSAANVVPAPAGVSFSETGIVKIPDGRLFSVVRGDSTTGTGDMWGSYSSDGGKTWTAPVMLFGGSGAPRVAVTTNGSLVVLYRHVNGYGGAPTPTDERNAVYRVSTDNGMTWGAEKLAGETAQFEMAYGTPIANADGTVTFIYANEASASSSKMVTTPNVTVTK